MAGIPAFGSGLLTNLQNNTAPAPTVEEILSKPVPSPPTKDGTASNSQQSKFGSVLVTLIGIAGTIFAGRKGWLGEPIKKLLGGKISDAKIMQNINERLLDYMSRTGDEAFSVSTKNNGKIRAERITRNGHREIITFDRNNGTPEIRTVFTKFGKENKELEYKTFKGPDVLDADFNETEGLYKEFSRSGMKRKFPIFGPRMTVANVRINDLSGKNTAIIKTKYNKAGKILDIVDCGGRRIIKNH